VSFLQLCSPLLPFLPSVSHGGVAGGEDSGSWWWWWSALFLVVLLRVGRRWWAVLGGEQCFAASFPLFLTSHHHSPHFKLLPLSVSKNLSPCVFQNSPLSSKKSPSNTAAKSSIYRRRGSGEGIIAHGEQGTRRLVG
jgi:hypothetical protein